MTGLLADETMDWPNWRLGGTGGLREGDLLRTQLAILRRLARITPADAVGLSRAVAQECVRRERYPL